MSYSEYQFSSPKGSSLLRIPMEGTAPTVAPLPLITPEENTCTVSSSKDLKHPANQQSVSAPNCPKLEPQPLPAPLPPLFFNDIAGLKDLSASISSFLERYDDLRNHLESIKAAILAKMPPETPHVSQPSPPPPKELEIVEEIVLEKQQEDENPSQSGLESLCSTMCSRGVRKYIVTHLTNLPMLREEVPKALKQAPNPSKLVLECLGKFFLQGSKAFTRDSPMIPAREASILILECFLLMMGFDATSEQYNGLLDIEKAVKEEADGAALAWRKRLITEGGLSKANQIDARGLLLFVACFGIPSLFKVEDIRDLAIAGNAKEILDVLRKSHVFISKISEMVEQMMKKKKEVDAVDIVYTFGLEERFNPRIILITFLRESKETWKKPKKGAQDFIPTLVYEANKKQLAALRSISNCLERHGIDPSKLLPGWQINEKIVTLQKEITDSDRKSGDRAAQKRKSIETDTSRRPKLPQAKRPHHVGHVPQQHKPTAHPDRRNLRELVNSYGTPAVVYGGPGAGMVPEGMVPAGVGPPTPSHGGFVPPYAVHEGVLVDAAGQVVNHGTHHPYPWQTDPAISERYTYTKDPAISERYTYTKDPAISERYTYTSQPQPVGLTTLYRGASTSVEGFPGNTTTSSAAPGHHDVYQQPQPVGLTTLYRGASTSVEGFPGNTTTSSAAPGHHDVYQFADSVTDPSTDPRSSAAAASGYASGSAYSALPAHVSSYLYQP